AQTGTGKTAAFAIPLIQHLMTSDEGAALVLTPTRELAVQVMGIINQLLQSQEALRSALLIGGEPMFKQIKALKRKPRIIVGTPGRIYDHLERGTLKLNHANFLVLDETDRMLDMGFSIQLEAILPHIAKHRQVLMFSATLPKQILRLAQKYLKDPQHIAIEPKISIQGNIDHKAVRLADEEKYGRLLDELSEREGSVIIFVKTKRGADVLAKRLTKKHHEANAIHGDLRQNKRDRVLRAFRNEKYRILVATDVAARGLDIPHVRHVINYDVPTCPEDYIHRIGRTARAGATGAALCFITPQDNAKWKAIDRMLHPEKYSSKDEEGERRFSRRGGGNRFGNKRRGHFSGKGGGKFKSRGGFQSRNGSGGPRKSEGKGGEGSKPTSSGNRPTKRPSRPRNRKFKFVA
ncbi:MAG TPA: DEAD/DEAH box helicase, partial [Opitutae bacterium]|nr:DEAD/DEAH box helicase [Opitutae bacterium]